MKGLLVALAILLLGLMACSESADLNPDGDNPDPCTPDARICEGNDILRCGEDGFEPDGHCESPQVCHLGNCTTSPDAHFERRYFALDESREIDLDYSRAGTRYLLALYSTRSRSGVSGYAVEQGRGCPDDSAVAPAPASHAPYAPALTLAPWRGKPVRLDRMQDRRLADRRMWEARRHHFRGLPAPAPVSDACTRSHDCPEDSLCEAGRCLREIPLYFDAWKLHTGLVAQVAAKGTHCAILADQTDSGKLDPDDARQLLESCDRLIVPRSRALFGEPLFTVTDQPQDLSDRNHDGLLHVLLSSKVNEEGVWGFFNSGDFWPNDDGTSNERDIIYVALPETVDELPSIEATIIHEYQHLLHFVIHNWGPLALGKNPDYNPVWLDEALAHLSEEIAGFGTDNLKLVADTLNAFGNISLTTGADSLNRRGMGMLLLLYLFEQAGGVAYEPDGSLRDLGGASFLRGILRNEQTGMASLEQAVGHSFREFYADWLTTLVAPESPANPGDPFRYQTLRNDPVTGMQIGVLTHGERHGIRDEPYTFSGPRRLAFFAPCLEETLRGGGAQYITLENPGNDTLVRLHLSADDADSHALLIRLH